MKKQILYALEVEMSLLCLFQSAMDFDKVFVSEVITVNLYS